MKIIGANLGDVLILSADGDVFTLTSFNEMAKNVSAFEGFDPKTEKAVCEKCGFKDHNYLWRFFTIANEDMRYWECTSCLLESAEAKDSPNTWYLKVS